jgi:mono/diheme cytochrome c family protein
MNTRSVPFLLAVVALTVVGCSNGGGASVTEANDTDLRTAVASTFQSHCVGCHNAASPAGGLSLVESRMDGSLVNAWSSLNDSYMLVRPGDPDHSFLVMVLRGDPDAHGVIMPPNGQRLSESEVGLISRWIDSLTDEQ